jgi:hypothetical protein
MTSNALDWAIMSESIPYMDYLKINVSSVQKLWFQPNTMIVPTNVPDRSGNGNTGTITWGSNASALTITIEGITASTGESGTTEDTDIEVLPYPDEFELFEDDTVDVSGFPMYDLVNRMADSLGWTAAFTYSIIIMVAAVCIGFGAYVATGTMLGFTIGFGVTSGLGIGMGVFPPWIAVLCIAIIGFGLYSWRRG